MPDREKVIKALERCQICDISVMASDRGKQAYYDCDYTTGLYCRQDKVIADALELLKEQEDLGTELTNAVELIHKKNERIEKLLKEQEHKDRMFHALEDDWKRLKELMKEQEAKTVIKIAKRFNDCDLTGFCPFCSRPLIKDWAENYCGYCGKPVLWEGR